MCQNVPMHNAKNKVCSHSCFYIRSDHSVKLKGVCAVHVEAVHDNAVAGMYNWCVNNPNTICDEVICCACLLNIDDFTLAGSIYVRRKLQPAQTSNPQACDRKRSGISQKNRLLGSLSLPSFHPQPVIRRFRHQNAHTNATSTPPSSVDGVSLFTPT